MPDEHQTSPDANAAEHPEDVPTDVAEQISQNRPVLPDPLAYHAYLQRLAKRGTRA